VADTFNYTVVDLAGARSTAQVTIKVRGVEDAPDGEIVVGDADNNMLLGGDGNDVLVGQGGDDLLEGGARDDALYGDGKDGVLVGVEGTGDGARYAGSRGEYHLTRSGNDVLVTNLRDQSADTLRDIEKVEFDFGGQANLVLGTGAAEPVSGSETDDYLFAGGGDGVSAGAGIDVVVWSLGDGNDSIDGGEHDDEVQLNISAGTTINVSPNEDRSGYTVSGGPNGHAFKLTLVSVEALSAWYQDEHGNWVGEELALPPLTGGDASSGLASFTVGAFSADVGQDAFDSGAPDTSVDFLI
jgi:Ca2+-binding RTX toxin-like protein